MATTTDLINDVYDRFTAAYAAVTAQGNVVVAFEPLGISPGLDPAAAGATVTALEFMSNNADVLPDLSGGVFVSTGRTVSGTYDTMLEASQPSPSTDPAAFNAAKAHAREVYQNVTSGSQLGAFQYLPAFAAPANWYDPSVESNWFTYSYQASAPSGTASGGSNTAGGTGGSGPVGRPPIRVTPPPWRLTARPMAMAEVAPANPALRRALSSAPLVAPHVAVRPPGAPAAMQISRLIVNNDAARPELGPQFVMNFEYCLVALNRPWLSGDFLAMSGWYVPGSHAGDYATPPTPAAAPAPAANSASPPAGTSGAAPAAGTSGTAAPAGTTAAAPAKVAPFSWVPVACIAVKNLVISAQGGGALQPSADLNLTSFGPFSLSDSETDGLKHPGIQIIAWICSAQPQLPPDTDPALIPPTTAQKVEGMANIAVGVLQGILGLTHK